MFVCPSVFHTNESQICGETKKEGKVCIGSTWTRDCLRSMASCTLPVPGLNTGAGKGDLWPLVTGPVLLVLVPEGDSR